MTIQHTDYTRMLPLWCKVRDVQSEEAVKARGTLYLPMLASQKSTIDQDPYGPSLYEAYKMRAEVHAAASRTTLGLTGSLLRKEPEIDGIPEERETLLRDSVGIDGQPLDAIVMDCLTDAVQVGRFALLVDRDADDEAEPYIVRYKAEDVLFWRQESIEGQIRPTVVVLSETYEEPKDGDYLGTQAETKPQLLVLRFGFLPPYATAFPAFAGAPAAEPFYWQERWRPAANDKVQNGIVSDGYALHSVAVPQKDGGRFWSEIPCDIVNATGGIRQDVELPPMLTLANLVLAHYRGSADLEHGRHMTAIPQPWASGFQLKEGDNLILGAARVWVTDMPGAQVGYLEFSGAGLGHIAEGQADKEKRMAIAGARMLEEQPAGVEAMGTVRLRQAGERSVLSVVAESVSTAITRAIQRWLAWTLPAFDNEYTKAGVVFALNADLDSSRMDPAELQAMIAALQGGAMSWETFSYNMRRGEVWAPGTTDEDERARIQGGAPGRSRKDELLQLQTDVREGRLLLATYLQAVQELGLLANVDIEAEIAALEEEKVRSLERQVALFAQRGGGEQEPGGGEPEDEPEPEDAEPEEVEPEEVEA